MALSYKKGTFTAPASPGTVTVTVGFQIKALRVYGTTQTAEGIVANQMGTYGLASGTAAGDQRASGWNQEDNVSTTNSGNAWVSGVLSIPNLAGTATLIEATLSAITSTSFDINFSTTISGAIFHYEAIGGSDITNAKLVLFNSATGLGSQTITGAGFTPTFAQFITSGMTATGYSANAFPSIGAAKSSSARWAVSAFLSDGATMTAGMDEIRRQRTDRCLGTVNGDTTMQFDYDFTNFNSDGCVLNCTDADASARLCAALFLSGPSIAVGAVSACTTTNCNNDVSVGFTPVGLHLATYGQIADNTANRYIDADIHFGGGDGTNEGTIGSSSKDATLPTQADTRTVTTKAIHALTAANPATVDGEADHFFPAGGAPANSFRLTWTDPPSIAAEICYIAMGDTPVVSDVFFENRHPIEEGMKPLTAAGMGGVLVQ